MIGTPKTTTGDGGYETRRYQDFEISDGRRYQSLGTRDDRFVTVAKSRNNDPLMTADGGGVISQKTFKFTQCGGSTKNHTFSFFYSFHFN